MSEVGVHETKTTLSKLLRRVAAGETITITRGGKPVARLVPMEHAVSRVLGQDQDLFKVPDDFDAPLPDELLGAFES